MGIKAATRCIFRGRAIRRYNTTYNHSTPHTIIDVHLQYSTLFTHHVIMSQIICSNLAVNPILQQTELIEFIENSNNIQLQQQIINKFNDEVDIESVKQSLQCIYCYMKQQPSLHAILTIYHGLSGFIQSYHIITTQILIKLLCGTHYQYIHTLYTDTDCTQLFYGCYARYTELQQQFIQYLFKKFHRSLNKINSNTNPSTDINLIIRAIQLCAIYTIHISAEHNHVDSVVQLLDLLYCIDQHYGTQCVHRTNIVYNIDVIVLLTSQLLNTKHANRILDTIPQLHTLLSSTAYNPLAHININMIVLLQQSIGTITSINTVTNELSQLLRNTMHRCADYDIRNRRCIPTQSIHDMVSPWYTNQSYFVSMAQLFHHSTQSVGHTPDIGMKSVRSDAFKPNQLKQPMVDDEKLLLKRDKLQQLLDEWNQLQRVPLNTSITRLHNAVRFNGTILASSARDRRVSIMRKLNRMVKLNNNKRYKLFDISSMPLYRANQINVNTHKPCHYKTGQTILFINLPIDILLNICTYVYPRDLLQLSIVTTQLKYIATHNSVWYHVIQYTFGDIDRSMCSHIVSDIKPHSYYKLYQRRAKAYIETIRRRSTPVYMCCICQCCAVYDNENSLNEHQSTHSINTSVQTSQFIELQQQFSINKSEIKPSLQCTIDHCTHMFTTRYYLNKHVQQQHYNVLSQAQANHVPPRRKKQKTAPTSTAHHI